MCKMDKYLIECLQDGKYQFTVNAVFETKELAENYIKLYLEGRKNCTFATCLTDYFYDEKSAEIAGDSADK